MDDIPYNQSTPTDGYNHQAINPTIESVADSNQASLIVSDLDAPSDMLDDIDVPFDLFCEDGDYCPQATNHPTGSAAQEGNLQQERYHEGAPSEPRNKQLPADKHVGTGQKRQLSSDKEQGRNSMGGRANRPHPPFNRQANSTRATDPQAGFSRGRRLTHVKGNMPHSQFTARDPRADSTSAAYPQVYSKPVSTLSPGWMSNPLLQYGSMTTPIPLSSSMPAPDHQSNLMPALDIEPSSMPVTNLQSGIVLAPTLQPSPTPAPLLRHSPAPTPNSPAKSSRGRGKKKRDKAKKEHEFHCHDHNKDFGTKHDLARHYQDKHNTTVDGEPIEIFPCTYDNCQKQFRRKSNLLAHTRSQHEGKSATNENEDENLNNGRSSAQLAEAGYLPAAIQQVNQTAIQRRQPLSPSQAIYNQQRTFSESEDANEKIVDEKILLERLRLPPNFIKIFKMVNLCLKLSKDAQQQKETEQWVKRLCDQTSNLHQQAEDQQRLNDIIANREKCEKQFEDSRRKLMNAVFHFQNGAAPAGAPSGRVTAAQQTEVSHV